MIRKVLIANRGEIACRIIRTCHDMGLATVAVYSDADRDSLHVEMADEAIHIGGNSPSESYLNQDRIIAAAQRAGADAIHPGYGFLAEKAHFAYRVRAAGLTFIGPAAESIEAMGDKRISKIILQAVPFVPGYFGDDQADATLIAEAERIGYPIMVKATAGGGGKGMRLVTTAAELPDALAAARREAKQAFGDDTLMLERAILSPRHIEVQIFGDQQGRVIALGERECSIQRRHQKIIEESPSSAISPELRQRLCATAISIGEQIGYYSAGTVEFLLDSNGEFYFMEMNTRLQVEHPVTEMVFGVDLVRWQIEVARGRSLDDILDGQLPQPQGHAIEVRIYAEDPANQFLPVVGRIIHWEAPPHVRTDTGVRSHDAITPYYDPLIAKVIAHGDTRVEAIRRLDYALSRLPLLGIRNNIGYLQRVLIHEEHLAGIISTHFVDEHPELLADSNAPAEIALIAASIAQGAHEQWRNNPNRPLRQQFISNDQLVSVEMLAQGKHFAITLNQTRYAVELVANQAPDYTLVIDGYRQSVTVVRGQEDTWWVHTRQGTHVLHWQNPLPAPLAKQAGGGSLRAPMAGQVIKVLVEAGQQVEQGALLMILEAMKMEHRIEAPYAGSVETVRYQAGDVVQQDEPLLVLQPI